MSDLPFTARGNNLGSAECDVLYIHQPDGSQRKELLQGPGPIEIGRSRNCDICLENEQVSRCHAKLTCDTAGRWWIQDAGSRNGLIAAGMQANMPVLLSDGTSVHIGPFRLALKLPDNAQQQYEGESTLIQTLDDAKGSNITALPVMPDSLDAGVLARLHRLDQMLVNLDSHGDRQRRVCEFVLEENQGAHYCAVVEPGPGGDWSKQVAVIQSAAQNPHAAPYLSRTLLKTVAASRSPMLLSSQGGNDDDLMLSIATPTQQSLSAIACPLEDREDAPLFYATFQSDAVGQAWIELMVLVADQFRHAQALLRVMEQSREQIILERDLHRARDIQTGLLPESQHHGKLEVAIGFMPCRWVGGDYVDVMTLPDGRVLVAIADVAGKGLPAALISSSIHTMVHAIANIGGELADIMTQLNAYLTDFAPSGVFATMILIAVDPETGQASWINAGHPPAVCLDRNRAATLTCDAEYLPLGIDPQDYKVATGTFEHGDTWVLYTDGLNEMTPPAEAMLGIEGVRDLAIEQRGDNASQCAENLLAWLRTTNGDNEQDDDQTLVVLQR